MRGPLTPGAPSLALVGSTHFELARILAAHGARNQAFFEMKLAITYQPALTYRIAPLVARMTSSFEDVLRIVPDGPVGDRVLIAMANQRRSERLGDLREQCLEEAIRRAPDLPQPRKSLVADLIASLGGWRAPSKCDGERRSQCIQIVEEQIPTIAKLTADPPTGLFLLCDLWLALGRADDVQRLLASECPKLDPSLREQCAGVRIRAATATGSAELVVQVVSELAANGCAAGASCGNLFTRLGRALEGVGRVGSALTYYQRAVTEDAADSRWADVARTARAVGELTLAANAIGRLSNRHPTDQKLHDQLMDAQRRLLLQPRR